MFDAIRSNPKIVQVVLGILMLPLALFGIDYLGGDAQSEVIARVGSAEISAQQMDEAMRDRESFLRDQLGGNLDRGILESPEFRSGVLDDLIQEAAVKATLRQTRMMVTDKAVQAFILARPEFQDNGQFSIALYDNALRSRGMTRDMYQQEVRDFIARTQLLSPMMQSAITPKIVAERLLALENEERTLSSALFEAGSFSGAVKLTPDAVKNFYADNQDRFLVPEQIKVEYVVMNSADAAGDLKVTEEDAQAWFNDNIKAIERGQQRRASHILVQVEEGAKQDVRQAARKRAEDVLAKVKAAPEKFAALAKENSDDKISAEQGGDVGFFSYERMVPAFSDAVYGLKDKEISGLVQSEFGYHIIMRTDGGKTRTYEESKAEALEGARKQAATKRFTELSGQFADLVNDKPDSLKPLADHFGLKLVQTDWLPRGGLPGVLQEPRVSSALLAEDSLKERLNIQAIDLGDGSIVSARILDYKAASVKPFEEVAAQVEELARTEESMRLAKARGEEVLEKLREGLPVTLVWQKSRTVKRSGDLEQDARKAVFGANAAKLPAYAGVAEEGGYVVYRIESVKQAAAGADDEKRVADLRLRYAEVLGAEDQRAFLAGVRSRLGVKITQKKPQE